MLADPGRVKERPSASLDGSEWTWTAFVCLPEQARMHGKAATVGFVLHWHGSLRELGSALQRVVAMGSEATQLGRNLALFQKLDLNFEGRL
jgi:hypothetical protein